MKRKFTVIGRNSTKRWPTDFISADEWMLRISKLPPGVQPAVASVVLWDHCNCPNRDFIENREIGERLWEIAQMTLQFADPSGELVEKSLVEIGYQKEQAAMRMGSYRYGASSAGLSYKPSYNGPKKPSRKPNKAKKT
jgi:hypothetical protein